MRRTFALIAFVASYTAAIRDEAAGAAADGATDLPFEEMLIDNTTIDISE